MTALALLASLMGCGGARYAVTANGDRRSDARVGERIHLSMAVRDPGCGTGDGQVENMPEWVVTPSSGARIQNGFFIADKPGIYEVTAPVPSDATAEARPAVITVSGRSPDADASAASAVESATNKRPTKLSKPRPKPKPLSVSSDPAPQAAPSSIELIFASGNASRVSGGGAPATFVLKSARRIRMLESYHLVHDGSAPAGGQFTLRTADGTTLGPFQTTRVLDSRSGLKNAYWFADVDFRLPAGTYTFIDSDPSTWSQNSRTNGVGFCGVSAVRR